MDAEEVTTITVSSRSLNVPATLIVIPLCS
jgi:hypothetical protein